MSIRAMSRVWAESERHGSELLMLLAIGDFADDEGYAYPAVATLARKCRMTERNAQMVLHRLIEAGELSIKVAAGPRGCNVYRLIFGGVKPASGVKAPSGVKPASGG